MSYFGFVDRIVVKAELMDGMIRTLGVGDALAEMPDAASTMRNAMLRCLACGHAGECAGFLESHDTAAHAPSWCRNRELFEFAAEDA